jgi:bifunctional non-homologous end joining protein LigD
MLASLDDPPLVQRGFVYEPKYDGIRALVDVRPSSKKQQPARVAMYSRNGIDKQAQFPAIVQALQKLATSLDGPVLLDAEVVAVDAKGTPLGFGAIQGRIHLTAPSDITRAESLQPAVLVVFDILRDGDNDLRGLPMAARRLRLQERVRPRGAMATWIRLSEIIADDGRKLLARAQRERWEGLIVKDGSSVYQSGRRTPAWRKLKITAQQEFVVVGWTDPQQSRQHFGALLLAVNDEDRLRYAGSVGTGFNEAELTRVAGLLARRARTSPPIDPVPKALRRAHWVTPTLVAEVRFTEWTSDGYLRHPVYLGLREDKAAADVVREGRPP